MKKLKVLATLVAILMMCTAVNFVPAITASAKTVNHQIVSSSDDVNKCGNYTYVLRDDNTAEIVGYNGKDTKLTIPASLEGHKVTVIRKLTNNNNENIYVQNLTIGNNVNIIEESACECFSELKSLNIGSSVKYIGACAFQNDSNLSSVEIENGLKVICAEAFAECDSIKSISLPMSVNRMGTDIFESNGESDGESNGLIITGYKGSCVEKYAENYDYKFKSVGQFEEAPNETNFLYHKTENTIMIDKYLGPGGIVVVPEKIDGCDVTEILDDSFSERPFADSFYEIYDSSFDFINSISLPKTLKNCYSNFAIDMPELNTIIVNNPLYYFKGYDLGYKYDEENKKYTKIKNLTIKGLTNSSAEEYAKENGLKFVSIGTYTSDGVDDVIGNTYIKDDYFYTLSGGKTAEITGYFGKSKNLTIPATINGHDVTKFKLSNGYVQTLTVGNNIKTISSFSINFVDKLKVLNIKSSVKLLENKGIQNCPQLTTINIEKGIKSIEYGAIMDCPKLLTISIPNSVNRIGVNSLGYVNNDKGIVKVKNYKIKGYSGSSAEKYAKENGFSFESLGTYKEDTKEPEFLYRVNANNNICITKYLGKGGKVVVPEKIDGHIVDSFGYYSIRDYNYIDPFCENEYKNFDYVTELTLPKTVTHSYDLYNYGIPKLRTLTIENKNFDFGTNNWGYKYDKNNNKYIKINNFTIKGLTNSSAEKYAKENGFEFVSIDTNTPEETKPEETKPEETKPETTVPKRVVDYPTEPEMKESTYTLPTVENNKVYAKKITLNKTKITLLSGKSAKLVVKVTPQNVKSVIWQTSNPKIATVENGVVKAKSKGNVTITIKTTDGTNLSAKCIVKVKQAVTSIKLNRRLIANKKGNKIKLKATVYPTKADKKILNWQTSNKKVVTVNKKGEAKITGRGCAIITCKSTDGSGVSAKCVVNNVVKAKSIKLDRKAAKINVHKTFRFKATVNGKCKAIIYSSSNKKIATVKDNGVVTGIENGKATIVAKTMDGSNKIAKCVVTVVGHNFGSWKTTKNPTCISTGLQKRKCNSCKKTETRKVNKTSHIWNDFYTVKCEPTCTDSGFAVIKCKYCNEERNPYVIPSLGHCYGASIINREATCTEYGLVIRKCKNCGNIEEKTVNKLGHMWSSKKQVIKAPTCQEEGTKAYVCLYCNATTDEEKISKTEHNYGNVTPIKPATFTDDGIKNLTCKNCGTVKSEPIRKIGEVNLKTTTFIYDGQEKQPCYSVEDAEGSILTENQCYTVSGVKNANSVGEYKIEIKFMNFYSGSKELTYKIIPKGTQLTSVTSAKNQIIVKWSKQATETTAYVLYYATKEDLSDRKYVVIKDTSTLSHTVTGLPSGTKYYVAVRTFKEVTINGETVRYYSKVSPLETITVK